MDSIIIFLPVICSSTRWQQCFWAGNSQLVKEKTGINRSERNKCKLQQWMAMDERFARRFASSRICTTLAYKPIKIIKVCIWVMRQNILSTEYRNVHVMSTCVRLDVKLNTV